SCVNGTQAMNSLPLEPPEEHERVGSGGGQRSPVSGKGQCLDLISVAFKAASQLAGRHVPEFDRRGIAAAGQQLAPRAESEAEEGAVIGLPAADHLACFQVP